MPHQLKTLELYRAAPRALDLSEYGTGKTIGAILRLREIVPPMRALVVAPLGVVGKWFDRELPRWGRPWKIANLTGSKTRRWAQFRAPHHVAVVNPEGLLVFGRALVGKYQALVLDEIHRFRTPSTDVSRAIAYLSREVKVVMGMTGSPILENPTDLYGVVRSVNPYLWGEEDFYAWRERLFVPNPERRAPHWLPKEGTMERLKRLLAGMSIRHLRSDLPVEWPRQTYRDPVLVDLPARTRERYNELERDFVAFLRSGPVTAMDIFPRLQKLCQLCNGYIRRADGMPMVIDPSPKVPALKRILREEMAGHERAVVWAVRIPDLRIAGDAVSDMRMPHTFVWGKTKTKDLKKAISDLALGKVRVLIANPMCIGEGEDLSAHHSIRFSLNWSHLQYSQPQGRFVRMTSPNRRIVYWDIVAKDTVEEDILHDLALKRDLLADLLKLKKMPRSKGIDLSHDYDQLRQEQLTHWAPPPGEQQLPTPGLSPAPAATRALP